VKTAAVASIVALLATGVPPASQGWEPEPAAYGVSAPTLTPVRMDDGVMISTEVVYPTDPATGARAAGKFPVLLTQNPYGAGRSDPAASGTYFVQRGYIYVASAIRGTGTSGGQVDWFGARQGKDGANLVNWAAHLPNSDGKVGLDGCSYLGVDQWFTAAAVGRNSALKAITPFCTDSDFYNDLTSYGGIPTTFVAGIARAEPRGPEDDPATDPQSVTVAQQAAGGPRSYDNEYWQNLDVQKLLPTIVSNGVPALTEAGWRDLFPGGNLGAYVAAQNAYFHRPLTAPIANGEPTTGRYQAIVGPWTHGEHVNETTLEEIRLEWFDTWLKGERTGMADTRTPLHLFENTTNRWVDTSAWPPSPQAKSYRFDTTGTLAWAPNSSLTYTTPPINGVLDGPSDLTVYATSTTPEVELSATVNVIRADGTVVKQADGILLGSQRKLDNGQSWYGTGHTLIQPSHPFTQTSQVPVPVGRLTRYDIPLLANFTELTVGDRLQVVLTSQPPASLHLQTAPTPQEKTNLAGGVYTITSATLNVPLASPNIFRTSPRNWGPSN
jgi:predicted acyl esterase